MNDKTLICCCLLRKQQQQQERIRQNDKALKKQQYKSLIDNCESATTNNAVINSSATANGCLWQNDENTTTIRRRSTSTSCSSSCNGMVDIMDSCRNKDTEITSLTLTTTRITNYYHNYFNKINQAFNMYYYWPLSTPRDLDHHLPLSIARVSTFCWRVPLAFLCTLLIMLTATTTTNHTTTICQAATLRQEPMQIFSHGGALLMASRKFWPILQLRMVYGEQQQQQQAQQQQHQQRQLQQQQLFALLTRNRQQQEAAGGGGGGSVEAIGGDLLRRSRAGNNRLMTGFGLADLTAADADEADDELELNDMSRKLVEEYVAEKGAAAIAAKHTAAATLETTGFVADDGQQYEKAEQAILKAAAAAAFNGSNKNCPKACKCLNDFFDCGKLQLVEVPELPDYVQHLDLIGNRLNNSSVLKISNLLELQKLTLKRNLLEIVPKFVGLTSLKHLNLGANRISSIDSSALAALPKLKSLDLTKNYLHRLEASFFPVSNRLVHLILNSNEIATVDENALDHLTDLVDLELNNNRIGSLPAGVFKNLNKLKKL